MNRFIGAMKNFQFIFECMYPFMRRVAQMVMPQNIFGKRNTIARNRNILVVDRKTGEV